jgi:glycosyltransferase involved in cell wall biosynthesis
MVISAGKSKMPRVDVIVPCYQYGRYLPDCVGSILSQEADLRVLIIDNASTDNSLEVANELAARDARVEVLTRKKNLGRHASYNEGIDWVSAEYFALVDADDLLAPGCLKRASTFMEQHPDLSFTYGYELRMSFPAGVVPAATQDHSPTSWEITGGTDFIRAMCRNAICHVGPTSVIRRTSAQRKIGHHRPELRYTDDLEIFLRLASVGDVGYTSSTQSIRRMHDSQLSGYYDGFPARDFAEREAAFNSFFLHEGSRIADAEGLHRRAIQRICDQAYWSGVSHLCRRQPRTGWELLSYVWARRPASFLIPPVSHFFMMDSPLTRLLEVAVEGVTGQPHGRFARGPTMYDSKSNNGKS